MVKPLVNPLFPLVKYIPNWFLAPGRPPGTLSRLWRECATCRKDGRAGPEESTKTMAIDFGRHGKNPLVNIQKTMENHHI